MIIGIDPGATTGWCIYDPKSRRAIECGAFAGHDYGGTSFDIEANATGPGAITAMVLERPKGYGPTRPQLVDCGYVAGRLVERLARRDSVRPRVVNELTRLEVCKAITAAVHGQINVRNDATAWAALLLLHGGEEAGRKAKHKKGVQIEPPGALGIVTGHARAALAVAVAWSLQQGAQR